MGPDPGGSGARDRVAGRASAPADVAQLVAHPTCNRAVTGSSPVVGSGEKKAPTAVCGRGLLHERGSCASGAQPAAAGVGSEEAGASVETGASPGAGVSVDAGASVDAGVSVEAGVSLGAGVSEEVGAGVADE